MTRIAQSYQELLQFPNADIHFYAIDGSLRLGDTLAAQRYLCHIIPDVEVPASMLLDLIQGYLERSGGDGDLGPIVTAWQSRMAVIPPIQEEPASPRKPTPLSLDSLVAGFRSAFAGTLLETHPDSSLRVRRWFHLEALYSISVKTSAKDHAVSPAAVDNFKELLDVCSGRPRTPLSRKSREISYSMWTAVQELKQLEDGLPLADLTFPNLLTMYNEWHQLRLRSGTTPASIWRVFLLSFIRIAGLRQNATLLGPIASSVKRLSALPIDYISPDNPILSSEVPEVATEDNSLALEWAVAEVTSGVAHWDLLLQSLRGLGLYKDVELGSPILNRFADLLLSRLAHQNVFEAHRLFKQASHSKISISYETLETLHSATEASKAWRVAIDVLHQMTMRREDVDRGLLHATHNTIKAFSTHAVVSLPSNAAAQWGQVLQKVARRLEKSPESDVNRRHWEWNVLVLARSMEYEAAVQTMRSLASQLSGRTSWEVLKILCRAQQFALAIELRDSLARASQGCIGDEQVSIRGITPEELLVFDKEIYEAAARRGSHRLREQAWLRLRSKSRRKRGAVYQATNYEKLLLLYSRRQQRSSEDPVPQKLFNDVSEDSLRSLALRSKMIASYGRRRTAHNLIRGRLVPPKRSAAHSLPPLPPSSISREYDHRLQHLPSSRSTVILNITLTAALTRLYPEPRSRVKSLREVLSMYRDVVGDLSDLQRPKPDRITLNILLNAIIQLPSTPLATVRWLFDAAIDSGYPSGEIRAASEPRQGEVFGTPQSPQSEAELSELKQILSATLCSSSPSQPLYFAQPISFRHHTEPLYKQFIKTFYQRGDIASARAVLSVYKKVKVAYLLDEEDCLKESWLGELSKIDHEQ